MPGHLRNRRKKSLTGFSREEIAVDNQRKMIRIDHEASILEKWVKRSFQKTLLCFVMVDYKQKGFSPRLLKIFNKKVFISG